jgi:hypothetical protein
MGGKYVGFFFTRDLNLHRPLTLELDFGPAAAHQDFVVAMEAFLDSGMNGVLHGLSLTAQVLATDAGRVVAVFPPLIKVLADPKAIRGFHVYAFGLTGSHRPSRQVAEAAPTPAAEPATGLNLRPRPGLGDRFDGAG